MWQWSNVKADTHQIIIFLGLLKWTKVLPILLDGFTVQSDQLINPMTNHTVKTMPSGTVNTGILKLATLSNQNWSLRLGSHLLLYFLHSFFILYRHCCQFLANTIMNVQVLGHTSVYTHWFSLCQLRVFIFGRYTFFLTRSWHPEKKKEAI